MIKCCDGTMTMRANRRGHKVLVTMCMSDVLLVVPPLEDNSEAVTVVRELVPENEKIEPQSDQ